MSKCLSKDFLSQAADRAAVLVRQHVRKDLAVQEGRVVWQAGGARRGEASLLCAGCYTES